MRHHRGRRRLLDEAGGGAGAGPRVLGGLALLGFSCVYREGFEVVLFLQSLRLKYGAGVVARGAALGIALTLAIPGWMGLWLAIPGWMGLSLAIPAGWACGSRCSRRSSRSRRRRAPPRS